MIELLFINLIPLYLLIFVGYIISKRLEVRLDSMAKTCIFVIQPVVAFGAIIQIDFNAAYLLLPIVIFAIASSMAILSYNLAKLYWKDNTANLIGMALGGGNTGYFGLPIVLVLFGPEGAGIYLLCNLAITLNECSICYYIGARGSCTIKDSLYKVLKLPTFHATWLAILISTTSFNAPQVFLTYWTYFTGAWVILGMMLIGIALAENKLLINKTLLAFMFTIKFIVWPLAMLIAILIDYFVLGLYGPEIYTMMLLIGIVPIIANSVAYAAQLDVRPGEAAMAVLLSTLFALFYIPFVFYMFGIEGF